MEMIGQRLREIKLRIDQAARRSGRSPQEITLVAVSKVAEDTAVRQVYELGVRDFGENRVQELVRKMKALPEARWHMIGRLQTNKVKDLLGRAYLIHSLDRWSLAKEIDHRAGQLGIEVSVLLQVNVSEEASKTGLAVEEVRDFLMAIGDLPSIQVKGLMTMAVLGSDPQASRPVFRKLAKLRSSLQADSFKNVQLDYLSMGMSQDFEVAIEEGANIVRIGSALFT